uniref:RNA-directed RNA polymerase n=1 Tax=Sclerotinia sclerotiorum umbra-like virus 1-U TaxID=2879910 RepID=A0A8K1YSE3_9TOMB|nr:RNA-dependent RNA polymerase [Sclerotinia sclerotiorum umbra-like virus 1-U]
MVIPSLDTTQHSCGPEARRRMYRVWVPSVDGLWAPAVHANCVHNEEAALRLRTLGPTPADPVCAELDKAFARVGVLLSRLNIQRWTKQQVVESYSGRMRQRYQAALESLVEEPRLSKYDRRLTGFLKAEKFNPLLKQSKPRMIMCRSPRFNLELASYLKPLEHALWRRWKYGRGGVTPTRVVGKGLNGEQRASLIRRKMESVGECTVFEIDGKAFEAHVTLRQVDLEHKVYKKVYPRDARLHDLLQTQRKLKGKTLGGIKFEREGCRASGDFNTGLGNTLVMGSCVDAILRSAESALGAFRTTFLADGDNALVFVETSKAEGVRSFFSSMVHTVVGQELTVEKPTTIYEEVVFGQCKPCFNGDHYTMVRHPLKTLSNAFSGYRHYDQSAYVGPALKAVCRAELALSRGIPLLEAYFARALERLEVYRDLKDPSVVLEDRLRHALAPAYAAKSSNRGVGMDARLSFQKAWGIGVEEQILMEAELVASVDHWDWTTLREDVHVGDGPFADTDLVENRVDLFLSGRRLKD